MVDDVLSGQNSLFSNTVENKKELLESSAFAKKEASQLAGTSLTLANELERINPTQAAPTDYIPTNTLGQDVLDIYGGFVKGAARVADIPLSAPNQIANAISAGAESVLTPLDFQRASETFTPLKKSLEIADFIGDKIEEKTNNFYGDNNVRIAEKRLRNAFHRDNTFFSLAANIINVAATSPAAVAQITLDSLPQMALLATKGVPFAATFMDMVDQRIGESKDIFIREHGREPVGQELYNMLGTSVASTAIETIESRFLLNKIKPSSKDVADILRLNKIPLARTTVAGLSGAAAEAFQEGSAQFLTELGGRQSLEDVTNQDVAEEVFVSAGLGAGPGGTIAGGASLAQGGAETAVKAAEKVVQTATVDQAGRADIAANSGDKLTQAAIELETDISTIESREERKTHLTKIFDLIQDDETYTVEQQNERDRLSELFTTVLNQNAEINAQAEKKQTTRQAEEVVLATDKEITEQSVEAAQQVVEAINNGETVDNATVERIKGSALFEEIDTQGKETLKLYENYTTNTATLETVNSDILRGNEDRSFIGIEQQQQRLAQAIELGNQDTANTVLRQIKNLLQSQKEKLRNPPKNKQGEVQKGNNHKPNFVRKVQSEIQALDSALRLFNKVATDAFGSSPFTEIEPIGDLEVYDPKTGQTKREPSKPTPKPEPKKEAKSEPKKETKDEVSKEDRKRVADKITKFDDVDQRNLGQKTLDETVTNEKLGRLEQRVDKVLSQQETRKKQQAEQARKQKEKDEAAAKKQAEAAAKATQVSSDQVGPITAFNEFLDIVVPKKSQYEGNELSQRIKAGNKTLNSTYRTAIIRHDNIIRAVQDIVRNCNG